MTTTVEDLSRVPTAGAHFLVRTSRRRILPLAKADPESAAEIEAIARVEEPYRLYYLPEAQDSSLPAFFKPCAPTAIVNLKNEMLFLFAPNGRTTATCAVHPAGFILYILDLLLFLSIAYYP